MRRQQCHSDTVVGTLRQSAVRDLLGSLKIHCSTKAVPRNVASKRRLDALLKARSDRGRDAERQVLADKYSTLSAEERTALPLNPTS
jgi:hypothetical protein